LAILCDMLVSKAQWLLSFWSKFRNWIIIVPISGE
jgi:hypothetical protein